MLRDFIPPSLRAAARVATRIAFAGAVAMLAAAPAACGVKGPLRLPQDAKTSAQTPSSDGSARAPAEPGAPADTRD